MYFLVIPQFVVSCLHALVVLALFFSTEASFYVIEIRQFLVKFLCNTLQASTFSYISNPKSS